MVPVMPRRSLCGKSVVEYLVDGLFNSCVLIVNVAQLTNFGNWAYFAVVGGDPKNRHFQTVSQAYCTFDFN